ncbi:endonuclease/exonuclease/phosphatase family protein [Oceanicola sp. 22II-s10i]|uniref:endonuclease/exonuclease/phosphatase family protein n=1 Tax=Oceanicola sp. 22II-s10i TaxID=1317116 RepID=UPI0020CE298C|nr:endonuclease/exonuclease/phosphatase family protein [Oceanicola sp. 22II-s10i]
MLRDIQRGDPQVAAVQAVIDRAGAEILLLAGIDHDGAAQALSALNAGLAEPYPHIAGLPGNAGIDSGLDLNGDGRRGTPHDMQAWGRFSGQGAMALLSRHAIDHDGIIDLTGLLWRDLPDSGIVDHNGQRGAAAKGADVLRLSTGGHWIVPLILPGGGTLTLLAFRAGPPVFDGPEDRNGWRNRDEVLIWRHLLDGRLGPAPAPPLIVAGGANLDPADGEGHRDAIRTLLSDPRLQDPRPATPGGSIAANAGHKGDPARDTVDWTDPVPGNLRVDYLLPSAGLRIRAAGGIWPPPDDPFAPTVTTASRHRLIWVDIALPD